MGNIARGLLESGANLGVSSRAMGSLKESNGVMVVQGDLKLSTAADIVADPSAPDAFVKGIMEGVEWIYDPVKGTWHEEQLHETRKSIHKMSINQIEEQRLAIFENYIASLAIKNKII
jgi:outer membrane protease